ncbi:hypothetical protein HDV57DRAFT_517235 [Trichoderma longibrachiatum]|uniref:Uncharacterized protein n=1 Tax=Trichoderma longibrachiatum ATCC 18648 TaxID=983965 RepID=A0A2T4C0C5_TRILO|nr:hypothetical protein M440DRAFT_1378923 [Trichoderma longibrachiatum ATCC 18648]
MFRSSLLRASERAFGARLAGLKPQSLAIRQPLRRIDATRNAIRLVSSSNGPPKPPSDKDQNSPAQRKLEPRPDVSTTSSVRTIIEPDEGSSKDTHNMESDLQHDVNIVKDTFRLDTVPRESHILGLTGTLPYLATSLSTVYLAVNLNTEIPSVNRFYNTIFLQHDTAQYLLGLIEPLQLGYGAVIISFLGAIHWGLEYAEKKPQHDRTRFRYGIGLLASVAAWPTLLMPVEYALTAQFGAFVALYYADLRATRLGWAPTWYAKYRFLLTAMVGLAIFVSLVGRAKITQRGALTKESMEARLNQPGLADTRTNWKKLEEEEKEKIRKEKEQKAKEEEEAKKKQKQKKKQEKKEGKDDAVKNKKDDEDGESKDKKKDDKEDDGNEEGEGEKEEGKDEKKDEGSDKENKGDKEGDKEKKDNKEDDKGEEAKEDDKPKDDKPKDDESKDDKSSQDKKSD